jgi:ribulose-5-phosphate 4-epimerase/fuculose-1-phosphate aldolase
MLREICDVFKEAYRRGWITTRDGNASYKRPEQDWFYVTPSGVRKNEMVPDMCIKMDINEAGTSRDRWLAEDDGLLKQQLNRGLKPTGELPMHWLLQRFNPTNHSRVVLHLHPTHIIAAMEAGIQLSDLADTFPEINRYTRVAYNIGFIEPITQELGYAVAKSLLKDWQTSGELVADVVGLKGHGAVGIGTDPWEAFENIERLEHICQIFLLSR